MSLDTKEPWTLAEEIILAEVYPVGGKRAALKLLPERSADAIKNKAQGMGLCATHLRKGGAPPQDDWSGRVPTHDYTEADFAWRSVRLPVFGPLSARL